MVVLGCSSTQVLGLGDADTFTWKLQERFPLYLPAVADPQGAVQQAADRHDALPSLFRAAVLSVPVRLGLARIKYFDLTRMFRFRHLHSIVIDQMLPHIVNYCSKVEVEKLMTDTGLTDLQLARVNEMSWPALGTRPAR